MKLRTVLSDGTAVEKSEFFFTPTAPDGALLEGVVLHCRAIGPAERREVERKSVKMVKNPVTRGMVREPDSVAAYDELVRRAVVSWEGIVGHDDKPLVCTDETKMHLPEWVKLQVIDEASATMEDAERASFREPESVVRMVGGSRKK